MSLPCDAKAYGHCGQSGHVPSLCGILEKWTQLQEEPWAHVCRAWTVFIPWTCNSWPYSNFVPSSTLLWFAHWKDWSNMTPKRHDGISMHQLAALFMVDLAVVPIMHIIQWLMPPRHWCYGFQGNCCAPCSLKSDLLLYTFPHSLASNTEYQLVVLEPGF